MSRRHRQKGALSIREFPPKSDCARAARCLLRRSLGLSISASRTSRSSQRFRPYWGKEYATEAARAAIEDGFGRLRLDQIVAMTVPGNVASRRVMERLGLTYSACSRRRARSAGVVTVTETRLSRSDSQAWHFRC